jgi:predicted NBD/HSP70 family sugar kinase
MATTARLTAGVDLGGTKIQTVVLRSGKVVGQSRVPTPQSGRAADVIEAIAGTVRDSVAEAGKPGTLGRVGIGTPGEIAQAAGVVSLAANVPGFSGRVSLGPRLSKALDGIEVIIDNDVRVAVRGEHVRGAGRPYRNMLGVWVGTGVGGGLVVDGELHGGRGAAGEIGHLVVQPGGRRCGCGRRGHLEAYAGRARLEARARRLVKKGQRTVLFDIMKKEGRDRLSSGVYARALKKGDPMTKQLVKEAAWALGIALASAQNLLDLEAIVVGGGLGDRLGQPFIDAIVAEMMPHLFTPEQPPVVVPTELGDLSGAVGAAVLAGG